jgi:hypothetical protein
MTYLYHFLSPDHTQTVRLILLECRVFRDQSQILAYGLPDEHAVERVFVLESRQLVKGGGILRR